MCLVALGFRALRGDMDRLMIDIISVPTPVKYFDPKDNGCDYKKAFQPWPGRQIWIYPAPVLGDGGDQRRGRKKGGNKTQRKQTKR